MGNISIKEEMANAKKKVRIALMSRGLNENEADHALFMYMFDEKIKKDMEMRHYSPERILKEMESFKLI